MNNSILSADSFLAYSIISRLGSIKTDTLIELDFNSSIISFKKEKFSFVFHPEFEVIASMLSGTNVT